MRFLEARPELREYIHDPTARGAAGRRLASVLDESRLRRVLARMLDEAEFLSPHGIRSLSRWHQDHPYTLDVDGTSFGVGYVPAESDSGMFGGNSNWRGPVWMPVNALIVRALLQYHAFYGDDFRVECPTGSGILMTLYEVAEELGPAPRDDLRAGRGRPAPGLRRHGALPAGPALAGPDPVLRVLPRRQRRRHRREPSDGLDRHDRPRDAPVRHDDGRRGRGGPKTLADLIAFNVANQDIEGGPDNPDLPWNNQIFEDAEATGGRGDAECDAARAALTAAAQAAVDDLMAELDLDAIIAPTNGPAWPTDPVNGDDPTLFIGSSSPSAVAGYANVTVPAGYVDGVLPIGVSFIGGQWDEPDLIGFAFDFEDATQVRVPPQFLATLPADPPTSYVREWNTHALSAIYNAGASPPPPTPPGVPPGAGQPPYVGALHMAMVQGAVYDAVNSIVGGYQPYLPATGSAPSTASQDAAVVTAAYEVLVDATLHLPAVTTTWVETEHAASMAEIDAVTNDVDLAAGVAAGHAAAVAMLGARATDGRFPAVPFFHPEGLGVGEWRRTGPSPDQFAWVGNVRPFMLTSSSQLRTKGPLSVSSRKYAKEYNEVMALGSLTGSSRTQAQTDLANFYVPNPVEIFNRTFRTISELQGLSTADEARLFGMLNLADADAAISCWNDKSFWSFWRPVTAIQNGDDDGNKKTDGDGDWAPLLATPPYPDHPSGYNCLTASMMHTAANFFGTKKFDFRVTRNAATAAPFRDYARFTDVVKDTIDARVYLGIHFRTADVQGAGIGKKVAHWLDKHYFQPMD